MLLSYVLMHICIFLGDGLLVMMDMILNILVQKY